MQVILDKIFAIVAIVFSIYCLIYHKEWSIKAAEFQKKFFKRDVGPEGFVFGYTVGPIVLIIFSVLLLLGIIHTGHY